MSEIKVSFEEKVNTVINQRIQRIANSYLESRENKKEQVWQILITSCTIINKQVDCK